MLGLLKVTTNDIQDLGKDKTEYINNINKAINEKWIFYMTSLEQL